MSRLRGNILPSSSRPMRRRRLRGELRNASTSGTVTIAPGTPAYVMVMQPIDSKHTKIGTPFHGILVQDIVEQNGVIAIPRGADVTRNCCGCARPRKAEGAASTGAAIDRR